MYQHLLVPIEGTELSEHAQQASLALAARLGARITGFVAEPNAPLPHMGSNLGGYQRQTERFEARTQAHAHEVLDRFRHRAYEQGVPFEGRFERTDAIDDAIVRAADELGCDLIVMATHGRGAFGELLFGSHTKAVISRSRLPLLVLH
ncbi:MAG: universal stress protein [Burkholderiaceae bacterium]|jgi:nucleotide-binding universal stress UspA family protein|nr:universal stress protein [Burkholderiaceae bacterium]